MKKIAILLLTLGAALALTACDTAAPTVVEFESDASLYSLQAVTASSLLGDVFANQALALPLSETTEDDPVVEDEIDELDKYLLMMETYLGGDGALTAEPLTSDRAEYQIMVVFTTKTITGESVVYTLYWNETPVVEAELPAEDETPTDESDPAEESDLAMGMRPDGFRFEDPEDEFVTALLEGLLVVGDTEVALEGKTIQIEDRTVVLLRAYIDQDNHVAVRYMSAEDGDKQFFYTVVENGRLASKTQVKVMTQDGKTFTQLMFVEGSARGRYNFSIETVENVTTIHINYVVSDGQNRPEQGNIQITATYDEATDTTTYEYTVRPDRKGPRGPMGPMEYTFEHQHGHRGGNSVPPQADRF